MAPEQFDADAGVVGPWTDVYGLGGILFSLLFGRAPRLGSPPEIWAQLSEPQEIAFDTGKHVGGYEPLAEVCRRALRRSIGDRFSTMAAFADALSSVENTLRGVPYSFQYRKDLARIIRGASQGA